MVVSGVRPRKSDSSSSEIRITMEGEVFSLVATEGINQLQVII